MTTENGNVFSNKRLSRDKLLNIPVFLAPALVKVNNVGYLELAGDNDFILI